ncbi:MAG: 16S rRNA methyltransferase, partial [Candidatus Bathyarchaeota archaeon]|nr:16S rRNA methyltransferase [Candidatus Bathyarchaeota archaeon]
MLTFILAESALETVPQQIQKHPSVRRHSKRTNKPTNQLLLDRSVHHAAMQNLENSNKRGRPDITHLVLLEVLGSPLNKEGMMQTFVHTNNNYVITINPETRLPRNYNQFTGLMQQLFQQKQVPPNAEPLLSIEQKTLNQLLNQLQPDYVLAFSTQGTPKTMHNAISSLQTKQNPAVIVGGFPHGDFTRTTLELANETVTV